MVTLAQRRRTLAVRCRRAWQRVALVGRPVLLGTGELVCIGGLSYGAWLAWHPLGWIAGGGIMLWLLQGFDRTEG